MKSNLSRRSFLGRATSALALPVFVPASALGRDGSVAPSNRIVMGTVGMGGRGSGVLQSWVLPERMCRSSRTATCGSNAATT